MKEVVSWYGGTTLIYSEGEDLEPRCSFQSLLDKFEVAAPPAPKRLRRARRPPGQFRVPSPRVPRQRIENQYTEPETRNTEQAIEARRPVAVFSAFEISRLIMILWETVRCLRADAPLYPLTPTILEARRGFMTRCRGSHRSILIDSAGAFERGEKLCD